MQRTFNAPTKSADRGEECILLSIRNELRSSETEALTKTVDAIASFQELGNTSLAFSVDWTGLEYVLNTAIIEADLQNNQPRVKILQRLGASVAQRIRSVMAQAASAGRSVNPNVVRSPYTPSTLSGSSLAVANELESLRNDLPESATSRAALASLVTGTSQFVELIDRLQDAGDPIWRVVTNPENEHHWNEEISETYFYAKGNTGVVIVRDDPMRYRVQSAKNNPTALIEGQLEISRSLANAAISVAGAVSGLPTSSLASSKTGSTTPSEVTIESDGLAVKQAKTEAWAEQRKTVLNSLQRYLRALATNVTELEDDDTDNLASQQRRFKSVLEGHKPLLTVTPDSQ